MQRRSNNTHRHIATFNPDVMLAETAHRDFLSQLECFNAGAEYPNFNNFILKEALDYKDDGDGVSYIVWNVTEEDGQEIKREVVAYYTIAATAILYEDRIRKGEEDIEVDGELYDIQVCGIPAMEIKMFAVDKRYQDLFYEYDGEDLPISAWVIRSIIERARSMITEVLGFKALFLHSVPEAEVFYGMNGFHMMKRNMHPLHNVDSEYAAMYLTLRKVHMNYET